MTGEDLKEQVLPLLKNVIVSGQRGWYLCDCVFCGKEQHLGVIFGKVISSFVCFKCGEKGTIFKLLKKLGRLDVVRDFNSVNVLSDIVVDKVNIEYEKREIDIDMSKKRMPLGFTRVYENEYLDSRGFSLYQKYIVGTTKIESKLVGYIIFILQNESGDCIGYLARTTKTKQEIDAIEKETGKKYLRYRNSLNTDFSKFLFGLNEITENTKTVILVEGVFDKFRVDYLLSLNDQEEIKCCACFGKKISDAQIYWLQKKQIKSVILLYDNDAVKESKQYAFELSKYFSVLVGFCTAKDPGLLEQNELVDILNNLEPAQLFAINKVQKKILK